MAGEIQGIRSADVAVQDQDRVNQSPVGGASARGVVATVTERCPAGAADGDGEVALSLTLVAGRRNARSSLARTENPVASPFLRTYDLTGGSVPGR